MTHHFTGTKPAQHRHALSEFTHNSLNFSNATDEHHLNVIPKCELSLSGCANPKSTYATLGQVEYSSYRLFPVHISTPPFLVVMAYSLMHYLITFKCVVMNIIIFTCNLNVDTFFCRKSERAYRSFVTILCPAPSVFRYSRCCTVSCEMVVGRIVILMSRS